MKALCWSILFVAMFVSSQSAAAESSLFNSLRWQHRIILLETSFSEAASVIKKLEAAEAAIDERHILWFVFDGESVSSNYAEDLPSDFGAKVSKTYFSGSDDVAVYLFGKDGGIKARQTELDLNKLFSLIDAMPMRRMEMLGQ